MRPIAQLILLVFGLLMVSTSTAQVWPGDINDNGEVNSVDILYWALSNNTDGPIRTNGSILWMAQAIAPPWSETFADGQNFAFADCNGDGQIDLVDKIIIQLNQDSSHAPYFGEDFSTGVQGDAPPLWLGHAIEEPIETTVGSHLKIPVHLGSASFPVEDFFGIAFRIMIDTGFIGNIQPTFEKEEGDWLFEESSISILNLDAQFQTPGKIGFEVALHLQDPTQTINGWGQIGDLSIIIEDDLTLFQVDTTIQANIEPLRMIDKQLHTLEIANDTLDIIIYQDSLHMLLAEEQPLLDRKIELKLYPNPALEQLEIEWPTQEIASIEIYNTLSQVSFRQAFPTTSSRKKVDIYELPPGPYWIRIWSTSGSSAQSSFIKIGTR